jgi:hypothetical protein
MTQLNINTIDAITRRRVLTANAPIFLPAELKKRGAIDQHNEALKARIIPVCGDFIYHTILRVSANGTSFYLYINLNTRIVSAKTKVMMLEIITGHWTRHIP